MKKSRSDLPDLSPFNFTSPPASSWNQLTDTLSEESLELVRISLLDESWSLLVNREGMVKLESTITELNLEDDFFGANETEDFWDVEVEVKPFFALPPPLIRLVIALDEFFADYYSTLFGHWGKPGFESPLLQMIALKGTPDANLLGHLKVIAPVYPQLGQLLQLRARHFLSHGVRVTTDDFPVDFWPYFKSFDLDFRPATYWDESAVAMERDARVSDGSGLFMDAESIAEFDEVAIASINISYDDTNSPDSTILFTAYPNPEFYRLRERDAFVEVSPHPIAYRSVSLDDDFGNWTEEITHSSIEPLTFRELAILVLDSYIFDQVSEDQWVEIGAAASCDSTVYHDLSLLEEKISDVWNDLGIKLNLGTVLNFIDSHRHKLPIELPPQHQ